MKELLVALLQHEKRELTFVQFLSAMVGNESISDLDSNKSWHVHTGKERFRKKQGLVCAR